MYRVLVVDDDPILRQSVKEALEFHDFIVDIASNGREAVSSIYKEKYDLVVMDVNMPEMNGIDALIEIKKHNLAIIVLILTAYSNVQDAVKAVKEGAFNYLEKPISTENLVALIKRALRARSMVEAMAFSAPTLSLGEKSSSNKFVGESGPMIKVFNLIEKLARVNTPVLIRGESGTGKELVARAIHYNGPRKDEKFVVVNCAAIPENLIESELFGHEKGAFTGAIERKLGKFQFANGGTLFLDEIGDISQGMQVKLLRVLQEKSFTPVGSNREIIGDVRVIAASNKNFEKMIQEGEFREDLFYRLNVLPVYLPPLRERETDIPHLVSYYINYFNQVHDLNIKGIDVEATKALSSYKWPGNIRELRNVLEHAFIIEPSDLIHLGSLPDVIKKHYTDHVLLENPVDNREKDKNSSVCTEEIGILLPESSEKSFSSSVSSSIENESFNNGDEGIYVESRIDVQEIKNSVLNDTKEIVNFNDYKYIFGQNNGQLDFQIAKDLFEKQFIIEALKINKGKINQTALKANIPKKTLLRKIEKYGISPREYSHKN